jgi:thiamine monophosphate kinase
MSSPRIFVTLALAGVTLLATACEPRATKEQCQKMVDQMTELQLEGESPEVAKMTRELMKDQMDGLMAECDGKASQSEVQCIIDAKTKADLDKCN